MALQTKHIEVARLQQMRIGGTVRRVARFAAFGLDRLMFENERSLFIRVAGKANRVARRG